MKTVNWHMKETFVFPSEIGEPTSAENIQVTPRFTEETVEGRPKLTGIYHLAVTVHLSGEKVDNYEVGESVVIDDLDLKENSGYFEYALPFNVDFPPEAENPVTIRTLNPTYEIEDHQLTVLWDIECTYEEAGIQQQNEREEKQVRQKSDDASEETTHDQKQVEKEEEQTVQAEQTTEKSEPPSETAEVAVETSSTSQEDEVLDFIAELEDGISATSFRLNDVLV